MPVRDAGPAGAACGWDCAASGITALLVSLPVEQPGRGVRLISGPHRPCPERWDAVPDECALAATAGLGVHVGSSLTDV